MMWSIIATTIFVVGVSCGPVEVTKPTNELEPPKFEAVPFTDDVVPNPATDLVPPPLEEVPAPATDLLPPFEDKVATPSTELLPPFEDNRPTLATDLVPPPAPEEDREKKPVMLFLINIFAVKNHTAEDSNDVLHGDFMEEVPEETVEPLSMFLLVVEDDDEDHPVSLDEVAKDLENEGFTVEKVVKDGETQLIKVDLESVESHIKVDENSTKDDVIEKIIEEAKEKKESDEKKESNEDHPLEESGKLTKLRRKRHICLKCKLDELKMKQTYGGGGCSVCGGGGSYQPQSYQPVQVQPVPIIVVPIQTGGGGHKKHHGGGGGGDYYPQPQPNYPQPQPNYPQPYPQPCNTCQQGGHYPQSGGGGNSYAQASAQASASAQSYSGSYGK